jgi:hypothetical protein
MGVSDAGTLWRLCGQIYSYAESAASLSGRITLEAKNTGKRSAGKPPAAFDVAGAGNVTMVEL